jgi:glucose/arabinose dehydrogenase
MHLLRYRVRMVTRLLFFLGAIGVFVLLIALAAPYLMRIAFEPTASSIPEVKEKPFGAIQTVAQGLLVPWELVFLPGGDMLVTTRGGQLLRIGLNTKSIDVPDVAAVGEGGLLGLALHPDFVENQWIYLYRTTLRSGEYINQVVRYELNGLTLTNEQVVLDGIPGARNHNGGRIAFGPDGYLYVGTGDAGVPQSAQDTQNLAGKILRVAGDGSVPTTNPFKNAVYSYGHRNVQGLTWDAEGRLFATEHGRSGLSSGNDELNRITAGGNFGWPTYEGADAPPGSNAPVLTSGPDETWAPSGLAYSNGHVVFTGLRGQSLYAASVTQTGATNLRAFYRNEFGRLRTVVVGPDGALYLVTNNTDGRGEPSATDDRIIKVRPDFL